MAHTVARKAPMLDLEIPSSPLLSSSASDTVFSPAVLTRRSPSSNPRYSRYSRAIFAKPAYTSTEFKNTARISTYGSTGSLHPSRSLPQITITRPLSEYCAEKELPPLPPAPPRRARSARPAVSAKQVIAILDLLDRIDRDMSNHVHRVKDSIQDARKAVYDWRRQRAAHAREFAQKREKERKETKGLDSDFWLGV